MRDITTLRLQVLGNGYTPLPDKGKQCLLKTWPKILVDETEVKRWDRMGYPTTGLRLDRDLAVVDVDVEVEDGAPLVSALRERLKAEIKKDLFSSKRGVLVRTSAGAKRAWFLRLAAGDNPNHLKRLVSREWMRPDDAVDDPQLKTARIEVYFERRQFGAFGPHTIDDDGTVLVSYGWRGRSPMDTPRALLPELTMQEFNHICRIFDEVAADAGLIQVPSQPIDSGNQKFHYVLLDDTLLDTQQYGPMTVAEARTMAPEHFDWFRCSASFTGAGHATTSRCTIKCAGHGLEIYVFGEDITYREVARKPDVDAAAEALRDFEARRQQDQAERPERTGRPMSSIPFGEDQQANFEGALQWLHEEMAWDAKANKGSGNVRPIWPDGGAPVTVASLRVAMHHFDLPGIGPRGGLRKPLPPIDAWLKSPRKIVVEGVRFRPGTVARLVDEGGLRYVNSYAPPDHPFRGGTAQPFLDNLARLIPDPVERDWFLQWLAYKIKHPAERMVTPVLVAEQSGTGRGMLIEVLEKLFGDRYVAQTKFSKLTGGEGSRFNTEMVNKLLIWVNEARDPEAARWGNRVSAWESFKDIAEPNGGTLFYIEGKGQNTYYDRVAISFLVCTNNFNLIKLPGTDRRLAVITNGEPMTWQQRADLKVWMMDPANIGALYRHLRDLATESDPAVFDPFMSPLFEGRRRMIDISKTDIEEAFDDAMSRVRAVAKLYTRTQISELMQRCDPSLVAPIYKNALRAHIRHHSRRIGQARGKNWLVDYRQQREPVYAIAGASLSHWAEADARAVKRELEKVQAVLTASEPAFAAGFTVLTGPQRQQEGDEE